MEGLAPDAVAHLAGASSVGSSFGDPLGTWEVNLGGTLAVLEAVREAAPETRVLVVSSGEIYGRVPLEDLPVGPDTPLRPLSPYGASKGAADLAAAQYRAAYGLPALRVRAFNHVGPGQGPRFVLPNVARQIAQAEHDGRDAVEVRVGNVDTRRDFTDVRDMVRAYLLVIERGDPDAVYLACSGRSRAGARAHRGPGAAGADPGDVRLGRRPAARRRAARPLWFARPPARRHRMDARDPDRDDPRRHPRLVARARRRTRTASEDGMPTALITGITGQDGSYLAELLLGKGYEVWGVVRRSSTESYERIDHLRDRLRFAQADLLDQPSLVGGAAGGRAGRGLQPRRPVVRADLVDPAGADGRVHRRRRDPPARGDPPGRSRRSASTRRRRARCSAACVETPQNEATPFYPRSPYGVAKAYGHYITVNYRESYGLFACSGILFNHESPRRGLEFVTRKVTDGVARIKLGLSEHLTLGNLDARRDWGFAGDYVEAMWRMLQQERARRLRGRHRRHQHGRTGWWRWPSTTPAWTATSTCAPTRRCIRPAEVDLLVGDASQGPRASSAGSRRSTSRAWCG